MRQCKLEPKAREFIKQYIRDHGEMTTEQIKRLIESHYNYDPRKLKEQDLGRVANQLVAGIKDESGIRSVYNYKNHDESIYVNVDVSKNPKALGEVEKQLSQKFWGLNASKMKVEQRRAEVEGQLKLDLKALG